jgi:hypothetical protein
MEHAAMLVEWLRRNVQEWDVELRRFSKTKGSIAGAGD